MMTAADSVLSCRRRSPLFEPRFGRFLSLNHRAMPRTRDPVWAHFTEIEEQYQGELTGQNKTRIKCKCEFGCVPIAFRIVDQLFNHLASPSEELRKSSGFARVKSAVPAVQTKYAAEIASRAWAWRCRV
jgi:uncharacterized protein YeaO (DUF488 family)